jgi:MFS family permease
MHGITFATIQTASIAFVHSKCSKDRAGEGQGLSSFVKSVGQLLGTTLGGHILQEFGSTVMYRSMAIVVSVSALLFFVMFKCYSPEAPKSHSVELLPVEDPESAGLEEGVQRNDSQMISENKVSPLGDEDEVQENQRFIKT